MLAQDARMIAGIDLALADNPNLASALFASDQGNGVVMLIFIDCLFVRPIKLHCPIEDFLALRFFGGQPQPLKAMGDRAIKTIERAVTDKQAHQAANR